MQGRLENEIKMQQTVDELMHDMPSFANDWCINLKASRRTPASCYDYAFKIKKFLLYIRDDIKNMTPEDITLQACESYMIACQTKVNPNGMRVYTSDSYQLTVWSALNSFLKFLCKRGYIEDNYMEYIEKPKNHDLDRINNERVLLTQKDFNKILKAAQDGSSFMNGLLNNRDVLIILLFMTTGMRRTAMTEINISDINFEDRTLKVIDKGNKIHTYILNEQVIEYMNKWMDDREQIKTNKTGDALFINRDGSRITARGIFNLVTKYCKKGIGKPLSPHKLRAGFCSILYNKTHDVEFVRRAVGHSNISTTERYIQTDGKEKEKAVQIMTDLLNI